MTFGPNSIDAVNALQSKIVSLRLDGGQAD
jgi:hypothetical protein